MNKIIIEALVSLCLVAASPLAIRRQQQSQPRQPEQPAQSQQAQQSRQQQEQPQLHEEVTVRWWLVPVYAIDKAGAPVLNLTPEDLDVRIKGLKVEQFSLIKKQFQVAGTKKSEAPAPPVQGPSQKKLIFLVFDAAFSPYTVLARARAIADTVIAKSDKTAQYVLLSIEPLSGLKYILGPTGDLKLLSKNMSKYLEGKKSDYLLQTSATDRHEINDAYPTYGRTGAAGGRMGGSRSYISPANPLADVAEAGVRNDWRDKRRVAASFASGLMTLDLVMGQYRDFSKVIYLYSCGIPGDALLDRTEKSTGVVSPTGLSEMTVFLTADTVAYDTLKMVGEHLNKSGALLFLVNPAGTRIDEMDKDSGEESLRILANESGGRYFEGAEKDISQQVNSMESGYYEISFPDKPEYEGQELNFEIRSNKPDVQIFTVRKVGREKSYAAMSEIEREVMIMNVLNQGPFSQTGQAVSFVPADSLLDGDSLVCEVRLPEEIARSEWTVYKIARNFATGRMFMDKEVVVPTTASVAIRMKWRGKEFRHDIVLTHPKTGTILVWK